MLVVQRTGEKAIFPEMPATVVQVIDVLRVDLVDPFECQPQRILAGWNCHQMHVVRHQAVRFQSHSKTPTGLPQEVDERPPIIVHEKHVLPIVAALRDVVRIRRNDHPG
jgi:hypothetical protein